MWLFILSNFSYSIFWLWKAFDDVNFGCEEGELEFRHRSIRCSELYSSKLLYEAIINAIQKAIGLKEKQKYLQIIQLACSKSHRRCSIPFKLQFLSFWNALMNCSHHYMMLLQSYYDIQNICQEINFAWSLNHVIIYIALIILLYVRGQWFCIYPNILEHRSGFESKLSILIKAHGS